MKWSLSFWVQTSELIGVFDLITALRPAVVDATSIRVLLNWELVLESSEMVYAISSG
jgi:hypothetical protein